MTNQEYINLFIKSLETNEKSSHTILYYKRVLGGSYDKNGNLTKEGFVHYVKTPFKEVDKMLVLSWKAKLKDEGLATSSMNTYVLAVHVFFAFLIEVCEIDMKNPARNGTVKIDDRETDCLNDDEINGLIKASRNPLDKAIIMTFVSTGMRFTELAHMEYEKIKRTEIDGETWAQALIVGKGNKERPIIIPPKVLIQIEYYYKKFRPQTSLPYLFVNRNGNELNDYSIGRTVKSLARKAGITNPERLHPHLFRHTYATNAMGNGVDLRIIQSALGHSDIRTTAKIYLHTDSKMLMSAAKKNQMFQGGITE